MKSETAALQISIAKEARFTHTLLLEKQQDANPTWDVPVYPTISDQEFLHPCWAFPEWDFSTSASFVLAGWGDMITEWQKRNSKEKA